MVGVEAVRAGTLAEALVDGGRLGSDSRGASVVGPALRSAFSPPARQRACQRLAFWRATPRWLATSAWERPVCSTTLPKPRAGRRHPHVGCQAAVDTPMDHPPAVLAIGTRSHAFSDRRAAAHASRQSPVD